MLYSTKIIKPKRAILEEMLEYLTEYDVYAFYLNHNFKVGKPFSSPFREDTHPSFAIYPSKKSGSLLHIDHGNKDIKGNCVHFVQSVFNITYKKALSRIYSDLIEGTLKGTTRGFIEKHKHYKPYNTRINVLRQKLKIWDIYYWSQYGVLPVDLEFFRISSIRYVGVNNRIKWYCKENDPIYSYKIFNKFKIYRPYASPEKKWLSNCSEFDIQGYEQLPLSGDLLIITKSLKDAVVLYKFGYPAIAPSSENVIIPKRIMDILKRRFKRIVTLYDRDKTGMWGARRMFHTYGTDFKFIPKEYGAEGAKDISDFRARYGVEETTFLLLNLFKDDN